MISEVVVSEQVIEGVVMGSIVQVVTGVEKNIGFIVRRILPSAKIRMVGPFVFFDHMGPAQFDSGTTAGDVRPHPHIGLATVTYLFSGEMVHRDSLGEVQKITPGDVNWMFAGRGIVHSERVPENIREHATAVQGLQMWVGLPQEVEQGEPKFYHYPAADLPRVTLPEGELHILVGTACGVTSPVKVASPTFYVSGTIKAHGHFLIPTDYSERALYVVRGVVSLDGSTISTGTLAILKPGAIVNMEASEESVFMLLGGEPLDGPRFVWWNFVASTKELIEAAKMAWSSRDKSVFPDIPGETEWIPLPSR